MEREQRRRIREIQRRRGRNINGAPEVRAAWDRCRALSLAYLDAVIAAHAAGGAGAVLGWGKYAHLSPPEQVARQEVDYQDWVRYMEDTAWFPGRTLGHPRLEALEAEIFAAWGEYAFHARLQEEQLNCAGFDVERGNFVGRITQDKPLHFAVATPPGSVHAAVGLAGVVGEQGEMLGAGKPTALGLADPGSAFLWAKLDTAGLRPVLEGMGPPMNTVGATFGGEVYLGGVTGGVPICRP